MRCWRSRGGLETHTEQGYNIGKPPYGYIADKIPHPVPARRAEGACKHRLRPDPVRGPVVTQLFAWRVAERLGYKVLAERLNQDLDRYPPPVPVDRRRTVGHGTQSSVRDVLTNPKHSGYMVWNRRATKTGNGRTNPPEAWVWSSAPTHGLRRPRRQGRRRRGRRAPGAAAPRARDRRPHDPERLRVAARLGGDRLAVGVASGFGASVKRPGEVHHNAMRALRFGGHGGLDHSEVERVAAAWRLAGFDARAVTDIAAMQWEKLICNVAYSAPCALTGLTVGEVMDHEHMGPVSRAAAKEAWDTARARGVAVSAADPVELVRAFGAQMPAAKPSALLDHEARRVSESMYINGAVPREAAKAGREAPSTRRRPPWCASARPRGARGRPPARPPRPGS